MMRELVVCTKQVEGEEGDAVRYRYSILIDEMDVGPFSCESYGVKIAQEPTGHRPLWPM